jgi:hypothetical protein
MKKNTRVLKVLIAVVCISGLVLFLTIKVINGFKDIHESFANDLPTTNSLPSEDSAIILKQYWEKIKVNKIINFKQRRPISLLFFDEKYYLIADKINLETEASMQDILHKTVESVDRTTGEVYSIFDFDDFYQFQYVSSNIRPVSSIFLTLSGDSIQTVINDSIARFNLLCNNLSIRFAANAPIYFYINRTQEISSLKKPARMFDLLILKRGLDVYFLAMTPRNPEARISPDLLYSITVGL